MVEDTSRPLLEVRDLCVAYGDINVLYDVSLSAWSGKVTAVLGANGAGKTTLLSAVAGLLRPQSGTIALDGSDLRRLRPYGRVSRGLALVQEGKRVFRQRTVHQNLLIGGYRLGRQERSTALEAAYERFPILADMKNKHAQALSGGQQQMLAIAQALMPNPKVLMLDEPSAGLAPIIVDELLNSIRKLQSEGVAIVLVEQLVDKALRIADSVLVLQQGRVVRQGPADTFSESELRDAYLGTTGETVTHVETAQ